MDWKFYVNPIKTKLIENYFINLIILNIISSISDKIHQEVLMLIFHLIHQQTFGQYTIIWIQFI